MIITKYLISIIYSNPEQDHLDAKSEQLSALFQSGFRLIKWRSGLSGPYNSARLHNWAAHGTEQNITFLSILVNIKSITQEGSYEYETDKIQ